MNPTLTSSYSTLSCRNIVKSLLNDCVDFVNPSRFTSNSTNIKKP